MGGQFGVRAAGRGDSGRTRGPVGRLKLPLCGRYHAGKKTTGGSRRKNNFSGVYDRSTGAKNAPNGRKTTIWRQESGKTTDFGRWAAKNANFEALGGPERRKRPENGGKQGLFERGTRNFPRGGEEVRTAVIPRLSRDLSLASRRRLAHEAEMSRLRST